MKKFLLCATAALCVTACDESSTNSSQETTEERLRLKSEQAQLEADRQSIENQRKQLEIDQLQAERKALERSLESAVDNSAQEQEAKQALAEKARELEKAEQALATQKANLAEQEQRISDLEAQTAKLEKAIARQKQLRQQTLKEERFDQPTADYGLFYNELQPHGAWFNTNRYGYVFQPKVARQQGWQPYQKGSWLDTDLGWHWDSAEPFGWATYHYGRWALTRERGWLWVPGEEWAPAWVAFRESEDVIGWAPLPPETLYQQPSFGPEVEGRYGIPESAYVFAETEQFLERPIQPLRVKQNRQLVTITRSCTNIRREQNYILTEGPDRSYIYDGYAEPVEVYRTNFDYTSRQGQRNVIRAEAVEVYAPVVDAPWNYAIQPDRVEGNWNNIERTGLVGALASAFLQSRQQNLQESQNWVADNRDQQDARISFLQQNSRQLEERTGKKAEVRTEPVEFTKPIKAEPVNETSPAPEPKPKEKELEQEEAQPKAQPEPIVPTEEPTPAPEVEPEPVIPTEELTPTPEIEPEPVVPTEEPTPAPEIEPEPVVPTEEPTPAPEIEPEPVVPTEEPTPAPEIEPEPVVPTEDPTPAPEVEPEPVVPTVEPTPVPEVEPAAPEQPLEPAEPAQRDNPIPAEPVPQPVPAEPVTE